MMRHVGRIALVAAMAVGLGLALGASDAYAACYVRGPTGGTMWTLFVTSGYWYTVEVNNLDFFGSVYVEVWDYCWLDIFGTWWCRGLKGWSGPWPIWATVTAYADDGIDYAWVVTSGNSYELCIY